MSRVREIIEDLRQRKKSVSCKGKAGLLCYMEELGFSCKDGKTPGHKVFVHRALTIASSNEFRTHSIDCGHAPNRPMKFSYVVKTISMVEKYQLELDEYLGAGL